MRWSVPAAVRGPGFAVLAVVLGASPAEAHLVTTGLGPVFDGIGHFVVSMDDLLPVLALALFAGLRGPACARAALFFLSGSWLAGGIVGLALPRETVFPAAAVSFLVLGGLVASDLRLGPRRMAALAMMLGLVHGYLDGAGLAGIASAAPALLGITAAIFTLMALVSALIIGLKPPWTRLVVRVAGSWIAAIGLLVIGWSLQPGR